MKQSNTPLNLLIGFTGSVASIKAQELINAIKLKFNNQVSIKIIVTQRAQNFLNLQNQNIYSDQDEWNQWQKKGDPVIHIELRKWADILLIAPLSANTLGKMANGLCDNLLTCVVRAWDFSKQMIVAPAMNTMMWESIFTQRHLNVLRELGVIVIDPICKKLMCGDEGKGAMEEIDKIVEIIYQNGRRNK